jgi:hypothetical protein
MSNCHLVAARSLIDLAASRLAFRAPARPPPLRFLVQHQRPSPARQAAAQGAK